MNYKIQSFETMAWSEIPTEKNLARNRRSDDPNEYLTICLAKVYKFEDNYLNNLFVIKDSAKSNNNIGLFWIYDDAYLFAQTYINEQLFKNMKK